MTFQGAFVSVHPPLVELQEPPIVAELESVFATLDDEPLLNALKGPTRRGPKGYPIQTLWRCVVVKYYLGLDSTATLLRTLQNNPFIAGACGITTLNGVPSDPTMSRFFKRLASKRILSLLKDVSRRLVRRQYAELPGFGNRMAMDSTTLKAWCNPVRHRISDKAAGWSVKTGNNGRLQSVYGWKLHLLVDCEYQMPVAANVSPGNVHDSQRATNLLSEARFTQTTFNPQYLLADAAYSSDKLRRVVQRHYHIEPLFDPNPKHYKAVKRAKNDPRYAILKRSRGSVERAFSQLKRMHALNKITTRGRAKVTAHCYLAIVALQIRALTQKQVDCLPSKP